MLGSAPGNTTWRKMVSCEAPSERAARTSTSGVCSTPCTVFRMIGNRAPMKVMKMIEPSSVGSSRIASGIQATAGIGRSSSMYGETMSRISRERPMSRPSVMPSATAIE